MEFLMKVFIYLFFLFVICLYLDDFFDEEDFLCEIDGNKVNLISEFFANEEYALLYKGKKEENIVRNVLYSLSLFGKFKYEINIDKDKEKDLGIIKKY